MTEQGYNGWSNYPTWAVALWINNDQGYQEAVHDALRESQAFDWHDNDQDAAYDAGNLIRAQVDQIIAFELTGDLDSDTPAGMSTDLLGWALDSADWRELGAAFLTDVTAGA